MIYIMRRTQIYLDDQLWRRLQAQARREKTTASELIRRALREKYISAEERREAMMAWAGVWKDRTDLPDTETYMRRLRGRREPSVRAQRAGQ